MLQYDRLLLHSFESLIAFFSCKPTLDVCNARVREARFSSEAAQRPRSDLPSATINEQFDTGDETGVIRS
jgi:hypothetical protein